MRTYGQTTTNRKQGRWQPASGPHHHCPECHDAESHCTLYARSARRRRAARRIYKTRARRQGARDIADQLG